MVIDRACERLGWNLAEQRCVVQGFGKVGGVAAAELAARGATVVGVGDYSGGLHVEDGLDVAELMSWTAEGSALADWQGARRTSRTRPCSSCRATCSCWRRSRTS